MESASDHANDFVVPPGGREYDSVVEDISRARIPRATSSCTANLDAFRGKKGLVLACKMAIESFCRSNDGTQVRKTNYR